MEQETVREAQEVDFPEIAPETDELPAMHLELEDLHRVNLRLTADLGSSKMKVKDVLELKVGSIVSLDKLAGELTDIRLAGRQIARGEAVVIGDVLNVRLSEITGVNES